MKNNLSTDSAVVEQGLKPVEPTESPNQKGEHYDKELKALVAEYRKLYPTQKVIHVTSDKMVFFNHSDANFHQSVVDHSVAVSTFKFK